MMTNGQAVELRSHVIRSRARVLSQVTNLEDLERRVRSVRIELASTVDQLASLLRRLEVLADDAHV